MAARYTRMGAGAVDAIIRRLFSAPGVAGLVGLLALLLGLPWLMGHRSPQGFELPLALASVALMAAAAWCMNRVRARGAAAANVELARKQAMFRDELEQRLQVQSHLRESEARLRAIIDSAPIVLFAIDREGAITFSAGVGPDPLGKKPGEALGWPASDLFRDHPGVVEGIRRALSGIDGQAELIQAERSFSVSLGPFRDTAGNTAGAIVVAVDVTERRLMEERLRQTVETLKQVDQNRQALLRRLVDAQEKERRAIARDIHDDTIQSMFAVSLRLSTLRNTLRDAIQVEQLHLLEQSVQASTERLRHLLFELRPAALDEGGLPAALREYLDVMKSEDAIDVELETTLERSPASETQVIAYRIAQEALANVRKHARASRVACAVSAVDDGILTRIADDGVGFEEERSRSATGHLGMVSMRERAEIAGGWFRVASSEGKGCIVEFWIPDNKDGVSRAA
ncbi:MAG TPA: PAS domain-containing protein [Candidatus Dormibacteraeota bacterium]|nr:PAS domain-containing protein [Candidatus Dormibacteraeota bacterium]